MKLRLLLNAGFIILISLTLRAEKVPLKIEPFDGIPGAGLSPLELTEKLQKSLKDVKGACVAVNCGSLASGVIISEDGYVLTAGHVTKVFKGKKPTIIFEDESKAAVKLIGYNESTDLGLLKIVSEGNKKWPCVKLADKVPGLSGVCFIYSHPSGKVKGRPAQVRLGRIISKTMINDSANVIISDCNIQPGDSGGPLFDIEGRLIGISSTAAKQAGYNRFASVEMLHRDITRLLAGEKWGSTSEGPVHVNQGLKVTPDLKKILIEEFQRRVNDKYPPVMNFIKIKASKAVDGKLQMGIQDIVNAMGKDIYPLINNKKIDYGIDAPDLIGKLPSLKENVIKSYSVKSEGKFVTFALPVTKKHLLVKLSEVSNKNSLLLHGYDSVSLKVFAKDEKWDLALLEVSGDIDLDPVSWPKEKLEVKAGMGLRATFGGLSVWGIACDLERPILKGRSIGPVAKDKSISSFRAPYENAVCHSLPLYAIHAGLPVYDLKGKLVGVHVGRRNRTSGIILTVSDIQKSVKKMLTP